MEIEVVYSGIPRRDVILKTLAKAIRCKESNEWSGNGIPVVVGFMHYADLIQLYCRQNNRPYVFIDHSYLNRRDLPNYGHFRMCLNHFHITKWEATDKKVPEVSPWNQGREVIVIPPSGPVARVYSAQKWLGETLEILSKSTNRKIIVKEKRNGTLLSDLLATAHAMVSFGSVAEVEAAIAGVPVFTTCGPSLPIAETDFSKIETPSYPEREQWLSALAGADTTLETIKETWDKLCRSALIQNYKQQ